MMNVITNNIAKYDDAQLALRNVMDPEIGLNIVDLGLLYQIDFDEGNKIIFVSMTLTTQFCPMGDSIRSHAVQAMQRAFPKYTISIELEFDPPWNTERISEQGNKFLNR